MPLWTKQGDTWQEVASADLKAMQSNSWQTVKKGWVKDGDAWQQFYIGSDPKTYTFISSYTTAGRGTTWKTSGTPGGVTSMSVGRYYDITNYPWYGLASFANDTTGVSLTTRMAERPVVVSASIDVYRYTTSGNNNADGYNTNLYVGRYLGNTSDSTPSNLNCNFDVWGSKTWVAPDYLERDTNTGAINLVPDLATGQALIEHCKVKPLCFSATTNNSGGSGGLGDYATGSWEEGYNYWHFWPYTAYYLSIPLGPVLTLTLDYA